MTAEPTEPVAGVAEPQAAPAPAAAAPLRARALSGSVWTIGAYGFMTLLRFGSNLVLAHVLFPSAFALVALASIVLQGLEMFSDLGITAAIVQSPRGDDPRFLNTAWTVHALRGCILWVAAALLAWPMAELYDAPDLRWFVPVCGFSFITTGFQSTKLATIGRRLDVKTLTFFGVAECVLKTAITVVWALVAPSMWALVGGSLITYTLSMVASHVLIPGPRNRFAWDKDAARSLMHFGRWVFVSTVMTFLSQQTDRLLLGNLAPMAVLGIYAMSFNLARLPMDVASQLAQGVLYPALAEVQRRDPGALGSKFRESRETILAAAQFAVVGVIFAAPWFFKFLYDSRYAQAAVFAPLLAGTVWFSILQASADRTLLAVADVRSLALANFANVVFTALGCVVGHDLAGMPGFIAGVGVGNLAGHVVVGVMLLRHGVRPFPQDLRMTAIIAAIWAVFDGVPRWFLGSADRPAVAIACACAGVAVSGAVAWRRLRPLATEFLRNRAARAATT